MHPGILEAASESYTNSVREGVESTQTGGRPTDLFHATAPGAVTRKRKAVRTEQESSSEFLISKRLRHPTLGLSIIGASLGSEMDQEEWPEMLADRVPLIKQISQMEEEMRLNGAWMTGLMEENRKKDKKILELQMALRHGRPTPSKVSGTPSAPCIPGPSDSIRLSSSSDQIIGPLRRLSHGTHGLGSQSYSRMRPTGSLDSPSPISQDFH